jgi:hypothetical protein
MTTSKTQRDENSSRTLVQTVGGMGMNMTLGIQLALSWVFFIGGGVWLDRRRGGGWAFTLLGLVLGLTFLGYEFWKIIRQDSVSTVPGSTGGDSPKPEERQ